MKDNMQLENQVCSLPLAQRLKELGVKQESLYFHVQQEGQNPAIVPKARAKRILSWHKEIVSAFTVAELGEMLGFNGISQLNWYEGSRRWVCSFNHIHQWAETEADARAKMLIYLLENKLITI